MSIAATLAVFDGFVNPGLVAGLALCSVPLLIHLLNRQRHKPVRWAAMRFVLEAVRRTRRQVQIENLLLLLLRIGAVAALALAVARPFLGAESPLAGLTESRRDLVLVLDGSASTGYGQEVETVFERVVDRARELVLELDGGRGDRVRVILAGAWPRLLSWTEPEQALAVLDTLREPTDERLDLAGALGEVLEFAEEEAAGTGSSAIEVRLLTDLQRHGFGGDPADPVAAAGPDQDAAAPAEGGDEGAPELGELLGELDELGLSILVEDLGPREAVPPNLGVTSVGTLGPVFGPGAPCDLRVEIANFGPTLRAGVRVWIEVDGERRPSQLVDVPARGRAETIFQVDFPTPGDHAVTARFEGDRLAVDNARVQVVRVPPPVRVLVVNGSPASDIRTDAAGMLMAVLEPPDEGDLPQWTLADPFDPTEKQPVELDAEEVDLAAFDLVWLADVSSLAPRTIEALEARVAAGAALVFSLGPHVQPELYDERFYRADGSGLLPAELARRVAVASRSAAPYHVREFAEEHPALAFFADPRWKGLLTGMPVYEFFATRPAASARVLARLDDADASPLLVERDYDRGKVFLWTTTIDPSWAALPEFAESLVPLVHELVGYAASDEAPPRNVAPGATVVAELSSFPRAAELVRPGVPRRPIEGEPVEVARDLWRLPPIEGSATQRAGLYTIETQGAGEVVFAVQIDPSEGDLERMTADELESLHPALRLYVPGEEAGERDEGGLGRRGELWRWLAGLALFALVGEALWAGWLGHKRRIA